jgi:hypothetical protein
LFPSCRRQDNEVRSIGISCEFFHCVYASVTLAKSMGKDVLYVVITRFVLSIHTTLDLDICTSLWSFRLTLQQLHQAAYQE